MCLSFQQISPGTRITDISGKLTFAEISRQAFMGGSVLYTPDRPSTGQLAQGVSVAVRLGYVDADEGDGSVYTDMEDLAQYGYIHIDYIDSHRVDFTYHWYTDANSLTKSSNGTIRVNESVDLNGDGKADLHYAHPRHKRPGIEKSLWLTFLSSQETRNTAMFAVLPEQYSRGVYPSGLLGINPDGRFIVNKYEVNSTVRSAVQGVVYGDYVLDSQLGEYQQVVSNQSYRSARTIQDSELKTTASFSGTSYYFVEKEFTDVMPPSNLLGKITGDTPGSLIEVHPETAIVRLNSMLEQRDLLTKIAIQMDLPTNSTEIQSLIGSLHTEPLDKVVEFNRYLLESLYPNDCPSVKAESNDITTIFPLLSVLISAPESQNSHNTTERNLQRTASLGTAGSYNEYKSQKAKIDSIFSTFYPLRNFSYSFPGWEKLGAEDASSDTDKTSTKDKTDDENIPAQIPPENIQPLSELPSTLKQIPRMNIPPTIKNGADLKIGVLGHFKITWGNVEGGLYAGVYISADTSLDVSQTLVEYPAEEMAKVSLLESKQTLLDLSLRLFDFPPIVIGVVPLQFSLNGGIEVPATIKVNGTVTTTMYAGFTGFYAVGFIAGADYGIKTKTIKIWRWKIQIPVGFKFEPYAKPKTINETAYYVGPISDVVTTNNFNLQSGQIELRLTPYVYVEPGMTVAGCLYGGFMIGPIIDLGLGIRVNTSEAQIPSKRMDIYGLFGGGLELRATFGIGITIPIINKKIQERMTLPLSTPAKRATKEYPISTVFLGGAS